MAWIAMVAAREEELRGAVDPWLLRNVHEFCRSPVPSVRRAASTKTWPCQSLGFVVPHACTFRIASGACDVHCTLAFDTR